MPRSSSRTRGVTVEMLDPDKLAAACRATGLQSPSYHHNGIVRRRDGAAIIVSSEGVGPTGLRPGLIGLDTQASDWEYLPFEAAEACRTGETRDLADHIRTFGDRLERNHSQWVAWTTSNDARTHETYVRNTLQEKAS